MKISKLLASINITAVSHLEQEIKNISCNSKKLQAGDLFVAISGLSTDGHEFIPEAVERGVRVIIGEVDEVDVPGSVTYISVPDAREVYAKLSACFFSNPSRDVKVIGVTGTNGKTTSVYLLKHILSRVAPCGLISTIVCDTGKKKCTSSHTTPDPYSVNAYLDEMRSCETPYCAMEVSSHALDQKRVWGIAFDAALFTNLTQDHLDYHRTMDAYYNSKQLLFDACLPRRAIINTDDPYGKRLFDKVMGEKYSFGLHGDHDFHAVNLCTTPEKTTFTLQVDGKSFGLTTTLFGIHNIYNILGTFAYAYLQHIDPHIIIEAIQDFPGVCGRMERVECGQPFMIFIDYAHTPDALMTVLRSVQHMDHRKSIVVFGCGGNRDQLKRPRMGEIASRYADQVILTTDNPRFENAQDIIRDIERGIIARENFVYEIIEDRTDAIQHALDCAEEGDVVIIAGKGHEEYMIIGDKKQYFSDAAVIQHYLEEKR